MQLREADDQILVRVAACPQQLVVFYLSTIAAILIAGDLIASEVELGRNNKTGCNEHAD